MTDQVVGEVVRDYIRAIWGHCLALKELNLNAAVSVSEVYYSNLEEAKEHMEVLRIVFRRFMDHLESKFQPHVTKAAQFDWIKWLVFAAFFLLQSLLLGLVFEQVSFFFKQAGFTRTSKLVDLVKEIVLPLFTLLIAYFMYTL